MLHLLTVNLKPLLLPELTHTTSKRHKGQTHHGGQHTDDEDSRKRFHLSESKYITSVSKAIVGSQNNHQR